MTGYQRLKHAGPELSYAFTNRPKAPDASPANQFRERAEESDPWKQLTDNPPAFRELAVVFRAPEFTPTDINRRTVTLSQFRDKGALQDF